MAGERYNLYVLSITLLGASSWHQGTSCRVRMFLVLPFTRRCCSFTLLAAPCMMAGKCSLIINTHVIKSEINNTSGKEDSTNHDADVSGDTLVTE